jgi:hypothetical protein
MENFDAKKLVQRELGRRRRERRIRLRKEAGPPQVWRDPNKKLRRPCRWKKRPHEPHTGCDQCGRRALLYSTIRGYVRDGRLRENWAARLLPRADMQPVALCVWCATNYLVERFGEEVRSARQST